MPKEASKTSQNKVISGTVEKTRSKAEQYIRDPERSRQLLDDALKKARQKQKNKGPLEEIWGSLTAFFRLMQAYIRREYTDIPLGSIVMVVVAVLYFVSPVDLVPDVIPFAGFIEDSAVIVFVLGQIKSDLDKFLSWEEEQEKEKSAQ